MLMHLFCINAFFIAGMKIKIPELSQSSRNTDITVTGFLWKEKEVQEYLLVDPLKL